MISPAFFVASMVGFHVEFSQSMYSSKCPYSTPISCTRVTGPSVYWRSSWARASSESEEAARHMDKIIVLIIFSSPVVIYLYSANTRINLTCPEWVRTLASGPTLPPVSQCGKVGGHHLQIPLPVCDRRNLVLPPLLAQLLGG